MSEKILPSLMPRVKPSQLPRLGLAMAKSSLSMMLYGSPGIGKTALIQELGREPELIAWSGEVSGFSQEELQVVTLSAPELNVEDLLGVPTVEELMARKADGGSVTRKVTRWATPAQLTPDQPFILFVDEPNRCEPSVRNALFQLITGRTTSSGFAVPPGSLVCMAGNRLEDRAGVRSLDTAFSNRCGHFELVVDAKAWLDWAADSASHPPLHHLVRAFVGAHPEYLNRFDPGSSSPQQATPRVWAGLGWALGDAEEGLQTVLIEGLLGLSEIGRMFQAFAVNADVVPTMPDLLASPDRVRIPHASEVDKAWILATAMADHLKAPAEAGAGPADPLGLSVGTVLNRLGEAGHQEPAMYAIRDAQRFHLSQQRRGGSSLRIIAAIGRLMQGGMGAFIRAGNEQNAFSRHPEG